MTVFITGNTGESTGPHLDFRVYNPSTGGYEDPSAFTSYLTVGEGKSPFDFQVTSGRGMREHPTKGGQRMHEGIDYATPEGTRLNVNGQLLSTWEDAGGGIMSQYGIKLDDGSTRELLLLHGSGDNTITGTGALNDYELGDGATPITVKASEAVERAKAYKDMSKAELDTAYDAMRSDPNKAAVEGMKMHKAYFKKP